MFPAGLRLAAFVFFPELRRLLLRHSTGAARERRRTLLRRACCAPANTAAPRVAPQVHRPPQIAAPRAAPQQHARSALRPPRPPSPGRRRRRQSLRRSTATTAAPRRSPDRAQRRLAARRIAAARPHAKPARPGPRDNLARSSRKGRRRWARPGAPDALHLLSKPSQTYSPAGAGHRALAGRVLSNRSFASKTATATPPAAPWRAPPSRAASSVDIGAPRKPALAITGNTLR